MPTRETGDSTNRVNQQIEVERTDIESLRKKDKQNIEAHELQNNGQLYINVKHDNNAKIINSKFIDRYNKRKEQASKTHEKNIDHQTTKHPPNDLEGDVEYLQKSEGKTFMITNFSSYESLEATFKKLGTPDSIIKTSISLVEKYSSNETTQEQKDEFAYIIHNFMDLGANADQVDRYLAALEGKIIGLEKVLLEERANLSAKEQSCESMIDRMIDMKTKSASEEKTELKQYQPQKLSKNVDDLFVNMMDSQFLSGLEALDEDIRLKSEREKLTSQDIYKEYLKKSQEYVEHIHLFDTRYGILDKFFTQSEGFHDKQLRQFCGNYHKKGGQYDDKELEAFKNLVNDAYTTKAIDKGAFNGIIAFIVDGQDYKKKREEIAKYSDTEKEANKLNSVIHNYKQLHPNSDLKALETLLTLSGKSDKLGVPEKLFIDYEW
jgi:hypothetical protein